MAAVQRPIDHLTANIETRTSDALRKNALGTPHIVFFVVAAAAPLTAVAGVTPSALQLGNGSGVPATFLLVGGLYLLFSVGFSAMSGFVLSAGGFYSYIRAGLGPVVGLGGALIALATYTSVAVALYGLFGFFPNDLVRLARNGGSGKADRFRAVRRPGRVCAQTRLGARLHRLVLHRIRSHDAAASGGGDASGSRGVPVAAFAMAGSDPYVVVFVWMSTFGSLGILLLQVMVSLAIIAFFWRNDRGLPVWRRMIAPGLGAVGLSACFALVVMNLDLVSSSTSLVVQSFPCVAGTVRTGRRRPGPLDQAAEVGGEPGHCR